MQGGESTTVRTKGTAEQNGDVGSICSRLMPSAVAARRARSHEPRGPLSVRERPHGLSPSSCNVILLKEVIQHWAPVLPTHLTS